MSEQELTAAWQEGLFTDQEYVERMHEMLPDEMKGEEQ
jgi:hypothetical protein